MNSLNLNIDMGEGFQNENQWKWGRGNKKTRLRRHWTNMTKFQTAITRHHWP